MTYQAWLNCFQTWQPLQQLGAGGAVYRLFKEEERWLVNQKILKKHCFFFCSSRFSSKIRCEHFEIAAKCLNFFLSRRDDVREISNEAVTSAPTRASIK